MNHPATTGASSSTSVASNDETKHWIVLGGVTLVLVLAYWHTLHYTSSYWTSPEYSHGYLVPVFAAILLWLRRESFDRANAAEAWSGVGLIALGFLLRLGGSYIGSPPAEMISFLPAIIGVFLLVGGWSLLRWAGPAVGFLIFMFPLPEGLSVRLLQPLQKVATVASTFALQTMGIAAVREGNRIDVGEFGQTQLGVVDACSGLRMSTIFLALAVAITLVTKRPWWERAIIILSAIPIALFVNVVRITVTGVLYLTSGKEIAEAVFHDLAGWIMMPMALGLLFLELQLLSNVFIEDTTMAPVSFGMPGIQPPRTPKPKIG
jgi:exosortase